MTWQGIILRFAGWATIVLFWEAQSWHQNTNLYEPMFMIWPDTRDIHILEMLITIDENKYFEKSNIKFGLEELGRTLHPAQDKHGHDDYYAPDASMIGLVLAVIANGAADGDAVKDSYSLDGVRYYHFDNLIPKTRDATYDILGRFSKKYPILRGGD